jgi:hypothetical protein
MSYDSSDDFYHLTPNGWVDQNDDKLIPADRVETWHRRMRQSSGWSKEDVSWTCVWAHSSMSRVERDQLREKYPIPVRKVVFSTDGDYVGKPL